MTPGYGAGLFPQHAELLRASAVPPELARARGYVTVDTKRRLEQLGVTRTGRNVPGLLVPLRRKDGSVWGYQYRPDTPRLRDGKPVKYETPTGQRAGLDVPPGVGPRLDDPAVPLWITEGSRKADAAAAHGLACVSLAGVWSWRGTNPAGGRAALPEWHDVALNGRRVVLAFDSDVTCKAPVARALAALADYLRSKGAAVEYAHLPGGGAKCGLDDYLAGHTVEELLALVSPDAPTVAAPATPEPSTAPAPVSAPRVEPVTLAVAHEVFRRWLGEEYDLDALDVVLAVAAAEQLPGDPPWLLVLGGPGNAKTETVTALAAAGAVVTSTISSEGALLSATASRERAKDATGGLLRRLGSRGLLVVKDVTSILSMNRDTRGAVLAALREVYDGRWERNVGVDGGRSLTWTGRLVVVGACTTAWDAAHGVVAQMGDRFLLVRLGSADGRAAAGRQALRNAGDEDTMRAELGSAVAGVLADLVAGDDLTLAATEEDLLLGLADVVTRARTAVERDYRGDVTDAHAPEMPTRFAKQLVQLVRGAVALGVDRGRALDLATRVARDSVPPLRLAVLLDLLHHPGTTTHAVRVRLDRPRTTVDQTLQAIHALGLATVEEVDAGGLGRRIWHYTIAGLDAQGRDALTRMGQPPRPPTGTGNVTPSTQEHREGVSVTAAADDATHTPTDIPRTSAPPAPDPAASSEGWIACPVCRGPLDADRAGAEDPCRTCWAEGWRAAPRDGRTYYALSRPGGSS